ncbi:MAG: ABC transporter substrate-binding protein [Ruminococcus sp.]|nr:ABC transporter substrate-binding protein [Ruminococcus sp.]
MRLWKKKALSVILAAAFCFTASSCRQLTNMIGDNVSEEQHKEISRPVVLGFSWWGNEIRSDYTIRGINEYEQREPGVDIRPTASDFTGYKENLDSLIVCRKEPDIMVINSAWLPEYSPDGEGFCNLYDYADKIDLSNFSETELSYGTVNGKLNALPVSLNAVTFYYNRYLLNGYGLSVPKTWDDLFACAEELSKHDIYTLGSTGRHYWKMLIAHEEQISGKEAFSADGFGVQNVVSMMEFYKQLLDRGVIMRKDFDRSDFIDGRTAGALLWVSDAQYNISPITEKGGTAVIGTYLTTEAPQRFGWYVKPTNLYAISKYSENPAEAASFLNYLMNDSRMAELQGTEKGVPLSKSALETLEAKNLLRGVPYQASQMIEQNAAKLELMPAKMEDLDMVNCFFEQFDLYYYGQKTVTSAAYGFLDKYSFITYR